MLSYDFYLQLQGAALFNEYKPLGMMFIYWTSVCIVGPKFEHNCYIDVKYVTICDVCILLVSTTTHFSQVLVYNLDCLFIFLYHYFLCPPKELINPYMFTLKHLCPATKRQRVRHLSLKWMKNSSQGSKS